MPHPHVKTSIPLRFLIAQLYPLLFLKANSIPIKLFNQNAHIRALFFSSSSVFTGSPTNTNLNITEVYKGKQQHPKEKKYTQITNSKVLLTLRDLMQVSRLNSVTAAL